MNCNSHATAGDVETSRGEYERFFAQWKDADADVPLRRTQS